MTQAPLLSVIIPVYNGGYSLLCCLYAIKQSTFKDWELIVVDDGSDDLSACVSAELGAVVLKTHGRLGPGAARNIGAKAASGHYVCFIDADCEVNTSTLANLTETLQQRPEIDALFGSYDDTPKATNFVAQYKNLFHHYVHQNSCEEASTFWAGCGVVKRSMFLALDGFDTQRYRRPSVEDIDLGYRIKEAGGKIVLAKHVQVKHHKAWNFIGLVKTDVCDRGIPWTILLLEQKSNFVNDLNLQTKSRISVVLSYYLLALIFISFYQPKAAFLAFTIAGLIVVFNYDAYRFFFRKRGLTFAVKAIGMHWFYYCYSGFAFAVGIFQYYFNSKFKVFQSLFKDLATSRLSP